MRRVYGLLLRLYPPEYRTQFGDEMLAVFSCAAGERRAHGGLAYTRFAAREYAGLLSGALRERSTRQVNEPLLMASVVMFFAVIGIRPMVSLPLALRANWIFNVTVAHSAPEYMAAIRRAVLALSMVPVWVVSAAFFFLSGLRLRRWLIWPFSDWSA